jgi:hypothetical protein
MPTLIRLIVALLVLAGIAFGGMLALTIFVDPGQKEIRVKIPARELGGVEPSSDPLGIRATQSTPEAEAAPPGATPATDEPITIPANETPE